MREIHYFLCPQCKEKAAIVDPQSVLGVRKYDFGGRVRVIHSTLRITCCHCGYEWDAVEFVKRVEHG